jgi:hypothetical protein
MTPPRQSGTDSRRPTDPHSTRRSFLFARQQLAAHTRVEDYISIRANIRAMGDWAGGRGRGADPHTH